MKAYPRWIDELLDREAAMFLAPHLDPDVPNTGLLAGMLSMRNAHAVVKLAGMYRQGKLVGRNERLAFWLYLAAAHLGHAGGARLLGYYFDIGSMGLSADHDLARKMYRWAARLSAQYAARRKCADMRARVLHLRRGEQSSPHGSDR